MPKSKSIKVSDGHAPAHILEPQTAAAWDLATRYRVEQITDSVEFRTGQLLERKQVEELCASNEWKVSIVPIPRS